MPSQTNIENLDDDERARAATKKGTKRASSSTRKPKQSDGELRNRLSECFDRIADALENRDDDELAAIIREDAEVMAGGLVSLTRPFKLLRMPLLALVAVVEPALAFGRIARVLVLRMADRRAIAREQRAYAQTAAEQEAAAAT